MIDCMYRFSAVNECNFSSINATMSNACLSIFIHTTLANHHAWN